MLRIQRATLRLLALVCLAIALASTTTPTHARVSAHTEKPTPLQNIASGEIAHPANVWTTQKLRLTLKLPRLPITLGLEIVSGVSLTWNSKRLDSTTGFLVYKYRHYSPELGRFISRDPIGENGGVNLYVTVGNRPIDRWDYAGLSEAGAKKDEKCICKVVMYIGHCWYFRANWDSVVQPGLDKNKGDDTYKIGLHTCNATNPINNFKARVPGINQISPFRWSGPRESLKITWYNIHNAIKTGADEVQREFGYSKIMYHKDMMENIGHTLEQVRKLKANPKCKDKEVTYSFVIQDYDEGDPKKPMPLWYFWQREYQYLDQETGKLISTGVHPAYPNSPGFEGNRDQFLDKKMKAHVFDHHVSKNPNSKQGKAGL